jgi:hypothetical protein
MVILEFLDMKSILRCMVKNRIAILGIIDIAIVFWIVWYERQIQYEPLLDYTSNLSVMKLPLHPEVYNTVIVTIIFNIVAMIYELRINRISELKGSYWLILSGYFFIVLFCMAIGYYHISTRASDGVIDEYNTLFRFPIWLFGKELFSTFITITSLYYSLCAIHICLCVLNLYLFIKKMKE